MHYNKKVGNFGEKLACKYLQKKGYKIISRNTRAKHNEIDIIAKIKEVIVFVEVKTRTNSNFGIAEDAICRYKMNHLNNAINFYLNYKKITHENFRLDYIAININKIKKIANIKHFKDIL